MGIAINMGGIVSLIMLAAGIALTVVTMLKMRSGSLCLPSWGKLLLSAAMILMLVITLLNVLPINYAIVEDIFITEHIEIVTPLDPSETTEPSQ